jgi:hypothetical protein
MSSFFDDLETQLRTAARARSAARPAQGPVRRWVGSALRGAPVAVAVATTLAIVAVALVLVHHGGGHPGPTPPAPGSGLPGLTSPRTRRELAYIEAATARTRRLPACARRNARIPAVIHGSPGAALRSVLGVLRRAPTPADRLSRRAREGLSGVYAGATRRALVARGVSYYVIPSRQYPSAGQPSPRCFDAQKAALQRDLPTIPPSLRAPTRTLQARLIAYDRRLISQPPYDVVCLATQSRNSGGEQCGQTAAEIARGGPSLEEDSGTYSGIVADGVASVTLRFPASGARPAQSSTGSVVGNVLVVRAPRPAGGMHPQPAIVLRSAGGRIIRTIPTPSGRATARFCRLHPIQCLAIGGLTESGASSSSSSSSTTATATTPGG